VAGWVAEIRNVNLSVLGLHERMFMFKEIEGDLFNSDAQALAHGVNIRGVMGAGIAKPFKEKFPLMYEEYCLMCRHETLHVGGCFAYYAGNGRWIYNIASQDEPGPFARVRWLSTGLRDALIHARRYKVDEIALPQIGCGIGGLDYKTDALPVFERLAALFPMVNLTVVSLP
jgi:O-acetyl-ADP-ribose deacetylase (regulator of RNase III)